MSAFPPNRYHDVEPARVEHGRTFVQAHQPASVLLSSTRGANPQQRSSGALPHHNVTLSTSSARIPATRPNSSGATQHSRANDSANTTAFRANGQSVRVSGGGSSGSNVPSASLHPNHIQDVFPDALSSLTKTEEHAYSSSQHAHTHAHESGATMHQSQQQQRSNGVHHDHAYSLSNSLAHHKIPLRMPIGPNLSHSNAGGGGGGSMFDPNASGMDDSVANGSASAGSATPHLAATLQSDRVQPLQRENLRLVRSNNALQAHLVAEGERIEESERNWAQELRTVKTKHADLQFLFAQKTRKIATQEQKLTELQQRLEQVLSDRQAYVKESIEAPSRLQSAPIQPSASFRAAAEQHPSEIQQMKQHEAKIAELTAELSTHRSRSSEWDSERAILLAKVSTRDEEVKRLSEVLESERNWDKIQVEFELRKQVKEIGKLNQQIDFLNEQRGTWERDIQSFKEMGVSASYLQQLQASKANAAQIEGELQQSQQRVSQLQRQVEDQNKQLGAMEASRAGINEHAQEQLYEREAQYADLQRKCDALVVENEQRGVTIDTMRTQLEQARAKLPMVDVSLLQENLKREESARAALRDQFTKLVREHDEVASTYTQTANELSMLRESSSREIGALQSDLLRAQYLNEDFQRRLKDLSESRANLSEDTVSLKSRVELTERAREGLGGERDYYRQQVSDLNATIHHMKLEHQQRQDELALLQKQYTALEAQLDESVKDRSRLMQESQTESAALHALEATVSSLQADLAQARAQNATLNSIVAERDGVVANMSDLSVNQRGLVRTNEKMKTQLDALAREKENLFDRLAAMTGERDALLHTMTSTDRNLGAIQSEISALHADRESKEEAYANLYADYTDVSHQLAEMRQTKFPSLQSQVASLKQENDRLQSSIADLHSNTVTKLTQTESSLKQELGNLKSAYADLQKRFEGEQDLTSESNSKISSLEHELHALQHQTSTKQSQLHSNATLLTHHTDVISKLNLQVQELKGACRSLEGQKARVEGEWKLVMADFEHCKHELQQQMELNTAQSVIIQTKGQEAVELKMQINALAEAKSQLDIDLHQSELRINALKSETQQKSDNASQLSNVLNEQSSHASQLQDALRNKEYELNELLQQISTLQRTNAKLGEENSLKSSDLKAILADLENIIKENQMLTRELNTLRSNAERTGTDADRLSSRLAHSEELFRAKELEALDLLSNYRVVCLENDRLKLSTDELESERKAYRQTLKQNQDALYKADIAMRERDSELRKRMVDIQGLEHALQELTRTLEAQRKSMDHVVQEKLELGQGLESMKMVSLGQEHSRSDHLRTLAEFKAQLQKAQLDMQAMQMDNQHLLSSLQQAKDHAASLEKVISGLRGQTVLSADQQHSQLSEKNARIGQLQQEMQQFKLKEDSFNEQIQTLQEHREQQNKEVNRLLQSLASASSSPLSPSKQRTSPSEFLTQIKSLQHVVDAQFAKIQDLQKDKAKLKGYILRYEQELKQHEAAQGGVSVQERMQYSSVSSASFVVQNA